MSLLRSRMSTGRPFWNKRARSFGRTFYGSPSTTMYRDQEQRLFRQYFGELRGKSLLKLDLWNEAQNTEILFWAANEGARCVGVDISDVTAGKAQARGRSLASQVAVAVGDISELPFSDQAFDRIYTMGTLEHLPDPTLAVVEMARVLKPEGIAIVGVPNRLDPFLFPVASRLLQALGRYPYGYEQSYTGGQMARMLEAQGLRVEHRDGILFLPWFLRVLDMFLWLHYQPACRLSGLLIEPFRRLSEASSAMQRWGYLTVCVARK